MNIHQLYSNYFRQPFCFQREDFAEADKQVMPNTSVDEIRILMDFTILYFVYLPLMWEDQIFIMFPYLSEYHQKPSYFNDLIIFCFKSKRNFKMYT